MSIQELKKINDEKKLLEKKLSDLTVQLEQKNRELEIEASLEKVRIKASAMYSTSGLAETSAVLFNQLNELGIKTLRTSVGILDDVNDAMELWVTSFTAEGEVIRLLDYVNLHIHPVFENIIPARRDKQPYALTVLKGSEVKAYYDHISTYFHLPTQKTYNRTEYYYAFFFKEGSINLVTVEPLTDRDCNTMVRFALAFGLVYTRFLELQKAEAQTKEIQQALTDLKATQAQLIQAEKMASLGELTAGIAHEIKNPLNFVNNFSEVNKDLLDELKEELTAGNLEKAKIVAMNIRDNEERIMHHGKRADAIVKSMLQHSRKAAGTKEMTDINALADEYLRLAYHGLRAKDKTFNAKFITAFDPAVGEINVIQQDLGRVILNLINNAFYAANQKKGIAPPDFEPTVFVSSTKDEANVMITVRDNGVGIPGKIIDKIFHPFFTTKPTGEGTGLGLSLAFDIITKGHGGELKVNTIEGEGTEFTIVLPVS